MATALVEPRSRYPMFNKAIDAVEKCGGIAKQKLLLDYDQSEFEWKVELTATFEGYAVPRAIEESNQQKKSRRNKLKGPERTNHHVVPKHGEHQVASPSQITLRLPNPIPKEHYVNVWLMYFKTLEKKVKSAIDSTATNLTECNLKTLCDMTKNLAALLTAMEKLYYEQDVFDASVEEDPLLQEILDCTDRMQDLLEGLKDSQIQDIIKDTVKPTKNHYLASILGFDETLVEYLATCDDYLTPEQWILSFIEWKQDLIQEDSAFESSIWEEKFQILGFTPTKASTLSDLVRSNPMSAHLSAEQWASRYIELQFKYNILLSGSRAYAQSQNIDEPYTIPTDVDEEEDRVEIPAIDKLRLTTEKLTQDLYFSDYLAQPRQPIASVRYWFHGTDSDAAMNICTQGISVDKGRKGLDFSDGAGFYLTRRVPRP